MKKRSRPINGRPQPRVEGGQSARSLIYNLARRAERQSGDLSFDTDPEPSWYSTLDDIEKLPEPGIGPAVSADLLDVADDVLAEIRALPEQYFHPYKSKER